MVSKENARGTGQRNPRVEVLPPLPDMHGMLGTMEHMLSQRDQRIALLEVHQQETDHRVKNSLQLVASLVRAQSRSSGMVDGARLVAEVAERIGLIARIHDLLCRRREGAVDLGDLLIQLCGRTARLLDSRNAPTIDVDTVGCELSPQQATAIALIVNELILNSFKHADSGGRRRRVTVRLRAPCGEGIRVLVEDDGGGAPPDAGTTAGMGMVLIERIARSVGASVSGQATGVGCRFTVDLPVFGMETAKVAPSY